jgi:hypothetical protein
MFVSPIVLGWHVKRADITAVYNLYLPTGKFSANGKGNLRTDPFERADITSNSYYSWLLDHAPQIQAGMALVQPFLDSFKEFPPRQKAASFTIDQALDKMATAGAGPSAAMAKSA